MKKAHRLKILIHKHEHWRCGKNCCMLWEFKARCICGGWKTSGTAGSLWTKQMLIESIQQDYKSEHLAREKAPPQDQTH